MLEGLGGSASTLPLFAVRGPRTNDFHAGFAANEERRADGCADRAPHRAARACPHIWPAGRPDLRMRVVFALIALIIAKAITLLVPIAYKAVVDLLTGEATGKEITAVGLAASPVFLIVAYGVGRVMMVVFAQFRDVWFTAVAQNAVRKLANRTFSHLHALSLRFHLERRTGGLNRVIERGVTGVDTIVRMAVLIPFRPPSSSS